MEPAAAGAHTPMGSRAARRRRVLLLGSTSRSSLLAAGPLRLPQSAQAAAGAPLVGRLAAVWLAALYCSPPNHSLR